MPATAGQGVAVAYDFAAYAADRTLIGYVSNEFVNLKGLANRKKALALKKDVDQAAIGAAIARLETWKRSGDPEPVDPQADPAMTARRQQAQQDLDAEKAAIADVWAQALAARRVRHQRRRGHHAAVDPDNQPKDAPAKAD